MNIARLSAVDQKNSLARSKFLSRDSDVGRTARNALCSATKCKADYASNTLNKWMKPYVPDGCVIHSFRHSLRDRLRAIECPSDIIDQVGGWATTSVGQGYGLGFPLLNLHRWMKHLE